MTLSSFWRAGGARARTFVHHERGTTAIEYALVATGIAVAISVAVFAAGSEFKTNYDRIAAIFAP